MNIKWHGTQFVPSVSNGFPIDVHMGFLNRITEKEMIGRIR